MTLPILKNKTISITKEELGSLPTAHYTQGAIVIDSSEGLEEAVEYLNRARIIGFDTETRPSFRKGQSHSVSLLQLASPERCYLFRLKTLGMPTSLKELLENPDKVKVGVSIRDRRFRRPAAIRKAVRNSGQFSLPHICRSLRRAYFQGAAPHQLGSRASHSRADKLRRFRRYKLHTHIRLPEGR